MTPARFRWGLILILLGVLWLMQNMDMLSEDIWPELLLYLPVVLIAIGIEKIFTKTKLSFISYVTSLALVAGAFVFAFAFGVNNSADGYFSESTFMESYNPDVKIIEANLDLGITDLTIRDAGEDIVNGKFDRFTRKPNIEYMVEGEYAKLTLHNRPHRFLGGVVRIEPGETPNWYLQFARDIPLELECFGEESDLHLNFATTPLQKLKLNAANCEVYLKLGDLLPHIMIEVNGDESRLKLRVPEHVGLKVYGDDYQAYLERLGLKSSDNGFMTDGFDSASNRIEVQIDDRLSSFSIDFF